MNPERLKHVLVPPNDPQRGARQWSHISSRLDGAPLRGALAWGVPLAAVSVLVLTVALFAGRPGAERSQRIALPDGSVVMGSVEHLVVVAASKERVELELTEGRATFVVTPDPTRPFVVHARDVEAHVLGTRFEVAVSDDVVQIGVLEGRLEVRPEAAAPRELGPGERWSRRGTSPTPPPVAPPSPRASSRHEGADGKPVSPSLSVGTPLPSASGVAPGAPAARELWSRAESAREAGNAEQAVRLFDELRRRYPDDPRAGLAAFEAARLRIDVLDEPDDAMQDLAATQDVPESHREHVAARRIEALDAAGKIEACRREQATYLEKYPQGSHRTRVLAYCRDRE